MPKLWVKNNGAWKQVQQLYIKNDGIWKSPIVGLINDAGIGKQFYPDTTPTVVYSTPGTRTYTVPAGVTSLRISYPSTSGMVNTTLAVTGGQLLNVVTGDYNVASSVGTLSIPAYSKIVFNHSAGNVDNTLTQTFTVATTDVANASTTNTNQSGSSTNLNVNGIFFQTNGEGNQGDFTETVQISTVPISTLIGNYRTFGEITRSTGASSATIEQQPTAANSWRARFTVTEFNYSNTLVTFRIIVEQQGWVQITPINSNVIAYNSPGTYTFTVPAGVTSVNISAAGGGGGGGSGSFSNTDTANYGPGGGGGGGAFMNNVTLSVTPGMTISGSVGAGGAGAPMAGVYQKGITGSSGSATTITRSGIGTITLNGGGGGGGGSTPSFGIAVGGAGGIAVGSGSNGNAGGGGNTGSSNVVGWPGGNSYSAGGAGGTKVGGDNPGSPGTNGGGGGGGSAHTYFGDNLGQAGGRGGNGFVTISYGYTS